jgi:hypothetical protein
MKWPMGRLLFGGKILMFKEPTTYLEQIIMLKHLYYGRRGWKPIADKIYNLINQYSDYIELEHIGFPKDWSKILY